VLANHTSKELSELQVYEQVEPFGERRADIRTALVCQLLANINRSEKTKPFELEDFILSFDEVEPHVQTADEIESIFKLWAVTHNATLEAQRKKDELAERRAQQRRERIEQRNRLKAEVTTRPRGPKRK
jgi:hypothetical protein